MRKIKFVNDEYYHIYNRGVDKRVVFEDENDLNRFFLSMSEFNVLEPIGSIYEDALFKSRFKKKLKNLGGEKFGGLASKNSKLSPGLKGEKLVEFICYNLIPNHYHFILKQLADNGIKKFMHRISTGYTGFFNRKYKRSGSLFQGVFKAIHIDSDEYLLHLSVYVNLNHRVHNLEKFGNLVPKLYKSSWDEYLSLNDENFCQKDIILNQFDTIESYREFAEESLEEIKERKEIKKFLLDD